MSNAKRILVLNSGSSSLKFQLFDMPEAVVLAQGQIEKIGLATADLKVSFREEQYTDQRHAADHQQALSWMMEVLQGPAGVIKNSQDIDAVGHRVVHGGLKFYETTLIDAHVLAEIHALSPLAPLHNPANAQGIEVAKNLFPDAAQVAVFDTAFYHNLPQKAQQWAIDRTLADQHQLRVFGFHGISHEFVSEKTLAFLNDPKAKVINLHLGNGCSATALEAGRPVDHSMGFGPLTGLVMGTRSGDIDPAVIFYLIEQKGMSAAAVKELLTKNSGMLGLTGHSDLRDIEAMALAGNRDAQEALTLNAYRIQKYVGAYTAALGGLDALVFTAGIGENNAAMRARICADLSFFGIELDLTLNAERTPGIRNIAEPHSRIPILVVPTNEELAIAQKTYRLLGD